MIRWLVVLAVVVTVSATAQESGDGGEALHDVVELRLGLLGRALATVAVVGELEGPAPDAPQAWTEVEAAEHPIGVAVGILDREQRVLGVRLFRPDDESEEESAVLAEMLVEPGVDGETELGDATLAVEVVDVRREPVDGPSGEPDA